MKFGTGSCARRGGEYLFHAQLRR